MSDSDAMPVRGTPSTAIGIHGATGRMGLSVSELIARDFSGMATAVAAVGSRDPLDALQQADVIIDFSLPDGTNSLLDWLQALPGEAPTLVCGTTGLDDAMFAKLESLSTSTKVMQSNNFSLGVAALGCIVEHAAPILSQLGYTPVLTEAHHRHKKDAPSGTAKTLSETLEAEYPDGLAIHSIRAGEVIGKHDITFYGSDDEIVIGHDAKDRNLFARGAIEAAIWLCEQSATSGRFTMRSYFTQRFLGQQQAVKANPGPT